MKGGWLEMRKECGGRKSGDADRKGVKERIGKG
jgi:hypothetical protein